MAEKNIVRGQCVFYEMHERAKDLRRNMTAEEKALWEQLRTNKLAEWHFRRQQIIDGYIVDFYCHAASLIIEVDGGVHDRQKDDDAERDAHLQARGFRILRFSNQQVNADVQGVLREISMACEEPIPPSPPFPAREGGMGG